MSQSPDRSSDAGSEYNWPIDLNLEQVRHEQVLFENIAEEYVKGDDITVLFTILNDGKINPDADRIGLTRIGCTNMKECLLYAPVQVTPSTGAGSVRHGTATFASTSLPDTENEFYQFCYINERNKSLGSSLPFQLNCSSIDADLLSNGKSQKGDRLITVADHDEADMLVISTQRMLTEEKLRVENRQLLDIKRRLESEQEELRVRLEMLEMKEQGKTEAEHEYQALLESHRTAVDELTARQQTEQKLLAEFDKTRLLCEEYHRDGLQQVERCRTLETAQAALIQEANQLRSQLAVTSQLTKDQATQIIDLERRMMQSNELLKTASQRQAALEQQARDQALKSEKRLLSLEGENEKLKRDIKLLAEENERLFMKSEDQQRSIEQSQRQLEQTDAEYYASLNQTEELRNRLKEISADQGTTITLKSTISMLEQRCMKHRNAEIEAKKTVAEQKNLIEELKRDNDDFRARFQSAEEEYKTLYRKLAQLQQQKGVPVEILQNSAASAKKEPEGETLLNMLDEPNQPTATANRNEPERADAPLRQTTQDDRKEIESCPICYFVFPEHTRIQEKEDHINQHFN